MLSAPFECLAANSNCTSLRRCNEKTAETFRQLSKNIFDNLESQDKIPKLRREETLKRLIIEDFDDEQIW